MAVTVTLIVVALLVLAYAVMITRLRLVICTVKPALKRQLPIT